MTGTGDRVDRLTPVERRDAARAVVQSVGSRYGLSVEEMRAPIVRGRRGEDVARTAAAVRLAAAILVDDLGLSMEGAARALGRHRTTLHYHVRLARKSAADQRELAVIRAGLAFMGRQRHE